MITQGGGGESLKKLIPLIGDIDGVRQDNYIICIWAEIKLNVGPLHYIVYLCTRF